MATPFAPSAARVLRGARGAIAGGSDSTRGGARMRFGVVRSAIVVGRARSSRSSRSSLLVTRAGSKYSLVAAGANLPHPDKVDKGGEDAWFAKIGPDGGGAMYLADGVGGFNEQGVDPGLYARVLTYEAAKAFDAAKKNPLFSPDPVKIMREAQENTKLPGASTCVLVSCDGTKIRAANLGDSGFRVIRGGRVVRASDPQEHYFNCPYQLAYEPLSEDTDLASDALTYEIDVVPGDLVVLGSDWLFDNVFDEEIAEVATAAAFSVAGAGALSAARASAEALARTARNHAEDPLFESPYALDAAKEKASAGGAKRSGPLGMLNAFAAGAASAVTGKKLGGKMDDITVVVGAVVATDAAKEDIAAAGKLTAKLQETADKVRKRAAGEEAKTLRSVNLRNEMDAALKEKVAEKEAKVKAEKAAPPEFPKAVIDKMDAATVRKLLEERGLPTSGKIDRLREWLGAVKRK